MEREVDTSYTPSEQARAQTELVRSLQMMGGQLDAMLQNFGWCAAQIAGDADSPALLRGMMEFGRAYHEFGLEIAANAIESTSGVLVDVVIPDVEFVEGTDRWRLRTTRVDDKKPGYIVGLIGISRSGRFNGIAVMKDSRGREDFYAVRIFESTGLTMLDPEHLRPSNKGKSSYEVIENLYPSTGLQ